MIFEYENQLKDHINAMSLQKANARKNRVLFHLILLLSIGCLVYLNIATFRSAFDREDSLSYGLALAVMGVLLLNYSPKIIPTIIYPVLERMNLLPINAIGFRRFEVTEKYLSFQYAGTEVRITYQGIARINYDANTVLFYLLNGSIESVPLRVLGNNSDERAKLLKTIESNSRKANSRKKLDSLPQFMSEPQGQFSFHVTPESAMCCALSSVHLQRKLRLRSPISWLTWSLILLCALGSIWGLVFMEKPPKLSTYLTLFYIIEAFGSVCATIFTYRPDSLVKWTFHKNISAGTYPQGYIGLREFEWNEKKMAFRYASFGLCIDWDWLGTIHFESDNLCFYQGNRLVLFIPKNEISNELLVFLKRRELLN